MEKLKQLLASRKFWAAVVGLAVVVLKAWKPEISIDQNQVADFVVIVIAYILGTAIEDSRPAPAAKPAPEERQ